MLLIGKESKREGGRGASLVPSPMILEPFPSTPPRNSMLDRGDQKTSGVRGQLQVALIYVTMLIHVLLYICANDLI
jgi:hypothetical protein